MNQAASYCMVHRSPPSFFPRLGWGPWPPLGTPLYWRVFSHKSMLLMVSGQRICRILLRQLLIKVCSFLMVVLVVLHVSAPFSSTDFTLGLNRLIVVCNDTTLELQMGTARSLVLTPVFTSKRMASCPLWITLQPVPS